MLGEAMALLRRGDIFHWPLGLFDPVISCPPGSRLLRMDPAGPVAAPQLVYDGAKWMCLPLPAPASPGCMVLSLGSNNQFEFEAASVALTQCSVHTFDCTVRPSANGSSVNPRRHAFSSLCVGSAEDAAREPEYVVDWGGALKRAAAQQAAMAAAPAAGAAAVQGSGGGGRRELGEARRQQQAGAGGGSRAGVWTRGAGAGGADAAAGVTHHVPHNVLIAKIDIEGFEYSLMSGWGPDTPGLPSFIALEAHNWASSFVPPPPERWSLATTLGFWLPSQRAKRAARAANPVAGRLSLRPHPMDGGDMALLLLHLARLGYGIVSREDNPVTDREGHPCCTELLLYRLPPLHAASGAGAGAVGAGAGAVAGSGAGGLRG
ncbi:hypothetical protein HXX76_011611 [Chlamydomonas incerta]|uniref:Methyltransferase domain-containing protein n=1 Tax=Chlamydomonas incerta TaxID=51695 RepID=A0A835SUG0_CHLIN|nr:hypothetical protein HXX76_011611 [Chlamydomonas incerta]|eukprot:KAG2428494.1 hypothetical protein HXX76_011611 [Chlamydomonas incerta]